MLNRPTRFVTTLVFLCVTSVGVAGCVGGPNAAEPAATKPPPASTSTPEKYPSRTLAGDCTEVRQATFDGDTDGDDPHRVGDYIIPRFTDSAPSAVASGTAVLDSDGAATAYIAASGDTIAGISERFCAKEYEIALLNHVRRNTDYSGTSFDSSTLNLLFEGDVINLDPAAVTSVGEENGVIYDNRPGLHLPPQE